MNRLSKSHAPHAPSVSKVVISNQPDPQEMDGALQQLKQGKELYVRPSGQDGLILTTKAPRWYTFKARKEQQAAQSVLLAVLNTYTANPNINQHVITAAATLRSGARNTNIIRDTVRNLAAYAKAMNARG